MNEQQVLEAYIARKNNQRGLFSSIWRSLTNVFRMADNATELGKVVTAGEIALQEVSYETELMQRVKKLNQDAEKVS